MGSREKAGKELHCRLILETIIGFNDIINPYNCFLKTPIFQLNKHHQKHHISIKKQHHISLNSQFIVVLDGINCFSVRFLRYFNIILKNAFSCLFFRK